MRDKVAVMFKPDLSLVFRRNRWYPDTLRDRDITRQLLKEAGIPPDTFGPSVSADRLDDFLRAAGKWELCVETIGDD